MSLKQYFKEPETELTEEQKQDIENYVKYVMISRECD